MCNMPFITCTIQNSYEKAQDAKTPNINTHMQFMGTCNVLLILFSDTHTTNISTSSNLSSLLRLLVILRRIF